MAILQANNLAKYFGSREIFSNLNFEINFKEKIALVGANGVGKSTLLKILVGEEKEDHGTVFVSSGTTIGYLAQHKDFLLPTPLWEFLKEPLKPIYECEKELFQLSQMMPNLQGDELENALTRYNRLHEWYEQEEGYQAEARLNIVFNGLGFLESDKERVISSFSGGERTRVELARRLLERPSLLILDEPTNHLDSSTIEWLENFLKSYSQAVLVVSHDRYFLDEVIEKVFFLESGTLKVYRGNYSQFRTQLEEDRKSQEKAYVKQQAYVKSEKQLIENAKETEKAQRFAKSREKRLEKIDLIERPKLRENMHFTFPYKGRSGNIALKADKLSFSFIKEDSQPIINCANFTVNYGDRIALIGPNGAGKTTLFKLCLGELVPTSGSVRLGASVEVSYFSQHHRFINEDNTILQEIIEYKHITIGEARSHLAIFLFKGDDVDKRVGDLSGGEKSRLVLAKLALYEGNFLFLDEPTNHLDIESIETLEEALISYPGTIFFISHDRYFVSKIARKIMAIQDGKVDLYPFNYQEYLRVKREKITLAKEDKLELKTKDTLVRKRERPRNIERKKDQTLKKIEDLEREKLETKQAYQCDEIKNDWEKLSAIDKKISEIDSELLLLYESWLDLEEGE